MPRVITWALATQRGVAYNPTFLFNELQLYLNFIAEYKDVLFQRVSNYASSRIKFLNAPVRVMETNIPSFTCYISSYFNFGKNRAWSCRATDHEFMHMSGGPNHLPQPHIMSANAGTVGNFTVQDYNYLRAYADKSARRPWTEPNAIAQRFPQPARSSYLDPLANESWDRFIEETFEVPESMCDCTDQNIIRTAIDIDDTPMFYDDTMIPGFFLQTDDPYP
jgi:hypothetical protein